MRHLFLYLFAVMISYSCNSKPTNKIDNLLILDRDVRKHTSLNQFTSFCVSKKTINNTAVCDSRSEKCRPGEHDYKKVLKKIGITVKIFDSLNQRLCRDGFKTYYRYGDYSIWVEDGAFGDIYGYLINHNHLISEVKSFEFDNKYHIGIGNQKQDSIP